MKAWNKVAPDSAPRLFEEHIRTLHHRRRMETASVALAFFGPVVGFVVVIAFLGTAAWLIDKGHGVEGTCLGTVDLVSLAAVFVLAGRLTSGPWRQDL
jgi:hypothetical protein